MLVGREQELSQLNQYLKLALSGKGSTVFISGEAGSGKSKLTHEFLNRVETKGITVLSGWCLSDAAVPYFPFVGAFDAYFGNEEEDPVITQGIGQGDNLLTNIAPTGLSGFGITAWLTGLKSFQPQQREASSPQVWKDQVFSAVGRTLHSLAQQTPTIFFIEDIHWADSASLALLHYLSRIIANERILILATFRSEELTADIDGHPHPLDEMMRQMKREDIFTEIKLPNLSQDNVAKIFGNMMGGNAQPDLVEKLSSESHGNALFLIESLRMLTERKSLIQEGKKWRLAEYEIGIPSKVKDIILRRLSILKFNQRRVLDAAAVIGEKFNVELLASTLNQDSLEILETLSFIEHSTSLVSVEGDFYRFDHAKSRETLYEEIPLPLKRGYHSRVAERIESKGKNGKLPLSDLAFHYAQADNKEKAVKFALAAGQDELARFSNIESIKHFKYVLDNRPDISEYANERQIAMEGLGDALYAMSLLEEAKKVFELLAQKAESGLVKLRALKKAMLCTYWLGNIQGALKIAAKAEEYSKTDRLEYARLRLHRGFITGRSGKNDEAIEDMEQALRVFEEEVSISDVAKALVELTFIYRSKGRVVDSLSAGLRSIRLFEELDDLRGQGLAYNRVAGPFGEGDYIQQARDNLLTAIKIEEKIGGYNLLAIDYWAIASTYRHEKDYKEAIVQALKGLEYAQKTDGYFVQCLCYSSLVVDYAYLKDSEHAEFYDKEFTKLLEKIPNLKDNRNVISARILSQAHLLIVKGQLQEAQKFLENTYTKFDNYSQSPMQDVSVKMMIGKFLAAQGKTEEAKVFFDEAQKIRREIEGAFDSAVLQADVMAPREIGIGESLNLRLDVVNVNKSSVSLVSVKELIPKEFKVTSLPSYSNLQNDSFELNGKVLKPFSVEPINLTLQITLPGVYNVAPQITYIDDSGETRTVTLIPITITARPMLHMKIGEENLTAPILPDRVSTGFNNLDYLLYGGIPKNYAVVLVSPPIDERELLVKRFLAVGAEAGETIFFITAEPNNGKFLAEKYPLNFYLFVCNPQADTVIQSASNVFKMKGVENLTEIEIALTKVMRSLNPANLRQKRACIEIVSDVLLQHHALITRKWLSGILTALKSKGFTTLAVLNPQMHPPEEAQAIIGLFDGEIRVSEKETKDGIEKTLRIRKLYNQEYQENELILNKERI